MPSEQLKGGSYCARGVSLVNNNYRGDPSLPSNKGNSVPEEKNTNLWITGLPGGITHHELLAGITKTGRVRSTVINAADAGHATAAASISFFRRAHAEALHRAAARGEFVVAGRFPRVTWNRNRVAEAEAAAEHSHHPHHHHHSRVVLVAGDPEVVNTAYLDDFFSRKFVYELDCVVDHGTVAGVGGPVARLEYRFGSFRSQAEFARMALSMELRGFLLAEYGEDPCAL